MARARIADPRFFQFGLQGGNLRFDRLVLGFHPALALRLFRTQALAESHQKFIKKYKLPFALLSDPDRRMMATYGAYGEKMLYGKKTVGVIRSTVWIGPDGKVKKHWARVANAEKHPAQVLAAIEAG
jgi:peroxiredoxin Q/BCP